jgi:hypothetical protein
MSIDISDCAAILPPVDPTPPQSISSTIFKAVQKTYRNAYSTTDTDTESTTNEAANSLPVHAAHTNSI